MPKNCPRRLLTHCALALCAGILLGIRLNMPLLWLAFAVISVLSAAACRHCRGGWLFLLGMFFFGGIALCSHAAHPSLPPEGRYVVRAYVRGAAKIREEDGRAALYLHSAQLTDAQGEVYALDGLYWTYWPEEEAAPPLDGQLVVFEGKVYHPSGRVNPYGFDFRLYLLQKGVQAGVSGAENLVRLPKEQTQHKDVFLRLRQSIGRRLDALLGDQSPLAKALLIGETEGMPEEMRESFRRAGVAHVLSVSGLHAVLIMSVVIGLLDRLYASPKTIFVTVVALLIPYALLTGANAPILRAAVLVGYQLYARVVRRRTDPLTACSLGALLILLFQPLQLFSAGFQMSFGAVLGMTLLPDALRSGILRIRGEKLRRLVSTYAVTLCASLGAALPVIYTYNSFSPMGLLVNPAVCALTEVLLLAEIALLAISFLSLPFAAEAGAVLQHLSRVLTEGVGKAGAVEGASLHVASPPWYAAAAVIICLLLCTRFIRLGAGKRVLLGGAALMTAAFAMLLSCSSSVRYVQLAMGNADAAVIEDGAETIVIDTGEYGGDLSSYLLANGRKADHLILTHLHTDHALGLERLLDDRVPIGCLYLSTEALKTETSLSVTALLEEAKARGIPICEISAGERICTERVVVEVLWPEKGSGHALKDANDCAMALGIGLEQVMMLHMSDVTGTYERYSARKADLLRIAHHGSADSTKEGFVAVVQPRTALISGTNPSEKTLSRLANAGAMVYDTGMHGALTVTVQEDTYSVQGYLR